MADRKERKPSIDWNDLFDEASLTIIAREWKLHLEKGDPSFFASTFLEWMRDPENHPRRRACTELATFMAVRSWKEVLWSLEKKLTPEDFKFLDTPKAEQFYDGFKLLVVKTIQDYWNEFLKGNPK
jgi:hypothetical protein